MNKKLLSLGIMLLVLVVGLSGCMENPNDSSTNNGLHIDFDYTDNLGQSLHSAETIPIGVAVDVTRLKNNQEYRNIVAYHFNSLTPENAMKMDSLVPSEGDYYWSDADLIVDFAEQINAFVHGHVLVWHNQLPTWVNTYSGSSENWKNLLENHIKTVVGRYKGKVQSWDVVNEAILDNGSGYRNTIWMENIGIEYIADAFRWAHEADPNAKLFYNDYSLAANATKLNFVINMIESLKNEGVPIHGVGFQMHITDEWPSLEDMQYALNKIEQLNIDLKITELDVSMNQEQQYSSLIEELAQKQKQRYKEVVSLFLSSQKITGISVWGVSDSDSWIPDYFNRLDWPVLFDQNYNPKLAAEGFLEALIT